MCRAVWLAPIPSVGDPALVGRLPLINRLYLSEHVQYGQLVERHHEKAEAAREWLLVNLVPGEPQLGHAGSPLQSFADALHAGGDWLAARDLPLGLHLDTIPPKGTRNTLIVFRDGVRGGYLVFPTIGVAFMGADLSVTRFIGTDLLHGSTEISGDGCRVALTLYG